MSNINIINVERTLRLWGIPVTSKMAERLGLPRVEVTLEKFQELGIPIRDHLTPEHVADALARSVGYWKSSPIQWAYTAKKGE